MVFSKTCGGVIKRKAFLCFDLTWPTKMLPATLNVSVDVVPIVACMTQEI